MYNPTISGSSVECPLHGGCGWNGVCGPSNKRGYTATLSVCSQVGGVRGEIIEVLYNTYLPSDLASRDLSQSPWTCRTSHSYTRSHIESPGRLMELGEWEWEGVLVVRYEWVCCIAGI